MSQHLSPRQRAMLAEMGIRLWPQRPAAPAPAAHPAAPQAAQAATAPSAPPQTAPAPQPAAARPAPPAPGPAQAPALARAAPATTPAPAPASPAPRPPAATTAAGAAAAPPATALAPRPAGVDSMDWPALQNTVAQCQACPLHARRKHTVFGAGDTRAQWMVVGEAPGEKEDLLGQPFVGPAGQLLDAMLAAIGLSRHAQDAQNAPAPASTGAGADANAGADASAGTAPAPGNAPSPLPPAGPAGGHPAASGMPPDSAAPAPPAGSAPAAHTTAPAAHAAPANAAAATPPGGVYIANVLKCRPPGNRNPQPDEVAQCEAYLRRQVALVQPRVILAMGRFAVQSLLQTTEPIGRLRGRVHRYQGVPVIVTYHPSYLLRTPADKAKAWQDLCLALKEIQASPQPATTP